MVKAEHGENNIRRELGRTLRIALEDALRASYERLTVFVFYIIFAYRAGSYRADKMRLGRDYAVETRAVHTLDRHAHYHLAVNRELRNVRNGRNNAELIEVVEIRVVCHYIFLCSEKNSPVAVKRRLQRRH